MEQVRVSQLKRGDVFYEVEHKVAVKWVACEDAKYLPIGWVCTCLRKNGVVIEFLELKEYGKTTKLFTDVNEADYMMG